MVIFMLPADLTSTAYRQCLLEYQMSTNSTTNATTTAMTTQVLPNITNPIANSSNSLHDLTPIPQHVAFANLNTNSSTLNSFNASLSFDSSKQIYLSLNSTSNSSTIISNPCSTPWNYVSDNVLTKLWRFIYWTSQILTWLVLPIMQSYSMAGDFTAIDKLKSAVRANLIYYSYFGAIFTLLLVYVIIKTGIDFANLKVIIISSSNTWGLFLLVVLLGYGLIELPRFLMNRSRHFQSLSRQYFRVGKLNAEKCEAEEQLDDVLEEIQQVYSAIGTNEHNPLKRYLNKIIDKCPPDWKKRSNAFRRQVAASNSIYDSDGFKAQEYDLQAMIRLHKKIIKAVHYHRQVTCRWNHLITEVIDWEDIARNHLENQGALASCIFKSTLPKERSLIHTFYTPKVEWYWKCVVRIWLYRIAGLMAVVLSVAVVWSEITFPVSAFAPRLSIFAYFVDSFQSMQQYFYLEVSSKETRKGLSTFCHH